jgi:tripartite-type tricarboxylate transporter receptor subunit TctC
MDALVAALPSYATLLLVAHPSVPARNIAELVALEKAKPGTFPYGTSGIGSTGHLTIELFNTLTGVSMTHVPYTGSGPALLGLVAGQVDVMFDNLPSSMALIKGGKLKAFAVTSGSRSLAMPDLPTIEEAGQLKGFEASSWFGLLAPAGTPAEVVSRLQQETAKALNSADMKEKLLLQGAIPSGNTPQEFAALIEAEIKKWALVVKASGARVD